MTEKGIKKILSILNIPVSNGETGFTQIPQLKAICTVNDGNQYYNYENELINFDITNGLVKIKEYYSEPCSGLLKGAFEDKKTFLMKRFLEFRHPKKGDKLLIINMKNNKVIFQSNIVSASLTKLVIEDDYTITDFDGKRIVYIDSEKIATSYEDPQYPGRYLSLTPKTKYTTDIYLGFDGIEGFRF